MDKKTIDQMRLCINEMQMVRQLMDTKEADTFCNRSLGIYVMMRVDDVTKIWSHNIPSEHNGTASGRRCERSVL